MPIRFPRRSRYGDGIIDAYSLDSFPADDDQPNDPASVRFQSIAEILLRGSQRCVAADREFNYESSDFSTQEKPVLGNLGDSLRQTLAFVSNKALSVSDVSKTPGIGHDRIIQEGGKS